MAEGADRGYQSPIRTELVSPGKCAQVDCIAAAILAVLPEAHSLPVDLGGQDANLGRG